MGLGLAELANRDGISVKCKGLMFKSGGATDLGIKPWVGNTMKQSDGVDDDDDDNEENEAGAVQQTSAGALMDAPAVQDDGSKFRTPTKVCASSSAPSPGSCSSARSAGRSARPPASPRPQIPAAMIQGIIKNARR